MRFSIHLKKDFFTERVDNQEQEFINFIDGFIEKLRWEYSDVWCFTLA